MISKIFTQNTILIFLASFLLVSCGDVSTGQSIDDILASEHRTEKYIERDKFRHPKETLLFFGVTPDKKVVEITPGMGWYAEILAPYLHDKGQYYYASYDLSVVKNPYFVKIENAFKDIIKQKPEVFQKLNWVHFDPNSPNFAPDGPVDMVLTFRNVHNWAKAGSAEAMFLGFAQALKSGGTLGVVEHRAKPGTPLEKQIKSGYMTEEYVVSLAESAGFRLDATSEINANPQDTADHPGGVWNLLPNLRGVSRADKDAMLKVGESDRMTLRFIKE